MGQIKHYNNGTWTIYTSGEDLSGYTGTSNTYYVGVDNTNGDYSKVNPNGDLINLEKPNVGFTGFTYEIGEYVPSEGGVIAHRWLSTSAGGSPTAGTVQNYLVLDTTDLSTSAQWATIDVDISNVESTWDGKTNTNNLIAAGAVEGITAGTAAVLCDNSTNQGKSDWYLPAIDELNKVWDNRWEIAQGLTTAGTQLAFDNYWSSSEFNVQYAFLFSFTNGDFTDALKGDLFSVRAMRKFSIQ